MTTNQMPPAVASLLVRQQLALDDEGIDAKQPVQHDATVLAEAVRVFRAHLDPHDAKRGVDLDHDLFEAGHINLPDHVALVACPRPHTAAAYVDVAARDPKRRGENPS